jgi:cadmium resistance protein CadD (predicted permease)
MRDILQKEWILTGIAPVLAGVTALANGEKAEGHENEGGLSSKW